MVTEIRLQVGKQKLLSALPFSFAAAAVISVASNAGHISQVAALGVAVAILLFCEVVAYLTGHFNHRLVLQYVKMVTKEQEKVQTACSKYEKGLTADLALARKNPWDFYLRLKQQQLSEVHEKHEAATGDQATDLSLSRMARDINDDLSIVFQVKEAGEAFSAEEMRDLTDQLQSTLARNKDYAASSKKTLDEANVWLAKVAP